MPPAKSAVWKHFKRTADDKSVKCILCSAELAYNGGTTSMHNHLRLKHTETTAPSPTKQPSMALFVNSPKKISTNQRESITQAIVSMIVSDYLPLSFVEGDGFRSLMKLVAPDYNVPCRKIIRARIMKKYDDKKTNLTTDLSEVNAASITTDTWTSTATDSYITVTEHHITDDWEMKSNVLMTRSMPERHTGVNIAERLQDCVAEFGLENKIEACVHDNARNMDCAGDLCPQWSDSSCFAHTLQLCIKPGLNLTTVEKTVSRCRKMVGHFKHSTTLTAEMRKRQKLFEMPEHELIQDVCTRWNSTQLMLERMCEQRRVVTDIMIDTKVTKKSDSHLQLTEKEWENMSELSDVLKPLTQVTTFLSGEKDISLSYVYPIVCGLVNNSLKVKPDDSVISVKVKECIVQELIRRFKPFHLETATTLPALASLLDPRYKRLPFFSRDQRNAAEDALESRLDDIPLRLPSRDTTEPPPCKIQRTHALEFLNFEPTDTTSDSGELREYLKEKSENVNPLEWWKREEHKYIRLSAVAKQILAVPATSVPSERVFSTAGLVVNKLRNRLSPDLVDSIIFLNKNIFPVSETS